MDEGKIVERGSYEQINRETENGEESVNEDESDNTKSVMKSEEKSESIVDESESNQDQSESNQDRLESSQDLLESNKDESKSNQGEPDLKQDQFESFDLSNRSSFAELEEVILKEKQTSRIYSVSVNKYQNNKEVSSIKRN